MQKVWNASLSGVTGFWHVFPGFYYCQLLCDVVVFTKVKAVVDSPSATSQWLDGAISLDSFWVLSRVKMVRLNS